MDEQWDSDGAAASPIVLPTLVDFYGRLLGYVVVLGALYLMATKCATALEDSEPKERPVLRQGLMVDEEEEEDDDDNDNVVEEIDTDEMLKGDGTRNRKARKAAPPASGPFPKELNPLTYKQPDGEKVSFRDLHNAMLNRYKTKYPNHGPDTPSTSAGTDDYDDEMKALLREHLGK
ncbi:hypothetical protein H310_04756 [Aphanomyces invadans]|uniref:Uncharacterized protein n=1 Tax=Aphanomyces invadans TaxID=157072 RepID=A0A024UFV1_9STRA|nr:hypothetical protein H310_04756 [Aphanomyces invadans]ETW04493.1 hypothetical protein H310_04756 [Aphanomyces invadans]|eukprot:XP_008867449.1 hypothetical protein H310_04756 [Aphanomyces invadans]